jgi:serine/threonine protein kinase
MPGLEGTRLGAYELLARIGGGGMAEVYRARQSTAFGREVAVKIIRPGMGENEDFRARFLREAQAISRMSHPNILPLIEFGEDQGMLYLVMPLAREGTLRDLIKQRGGPIPPEEAIPLFLQLCNAVQYAHEQGIVHRDLKPQNVLLQQRTHVLLADFGIARDSSVETHLTTTGAGIGTVEYMAPEQAIGQADMRSDIYSLGIVLYQLLTGTVPYSGSTPFQILLKHTNEQLPDPRAYNPRIPAEMVEVLRVALAKNVQDRFQSAQALARAVQRVQPGGAQGTGASFPAMAVLPPDASMLSSRENARPQPMPTDEETRSGPPPSRLTIGPQPTGPTGTTTPPPPILPFPAADSGAPPTAATGLAFQTRSGNEPPPVPRGWASAPEPANEWNDLPTMGYTNAGQQQRRPGGAPPPNRGGFPPYAGGGQPFPQPPVKKNRRNLVVALIAALLLIVLLAGGVFAIFGSGSKPPNNTANSPTNTALPTQAQAAATATATATNTPSPTATDTPVPPTNTPRPPTATATATPVPCANITGTYSGTWGLNGPGSNPMSLNITQSGSNLSGTTTEGSTTYNDSGTINCNGSFTINETSSSSGTATLFGSVLGPHHLGGTWSSSSSGGSGDWDVS